jgi:hypothetical protein
LGSFGSRNSWVVVGVDVVGEVVVESLRGTVLDEAGSEVVVVELVAIVEPGTTSGRSLDAHATAMVTIRIATTTGRGARAMARDPIDPRRPGERTRGAGNVAA